MKRSYSLLLSLCLISKHRFSPGVRKSGFSFQSQSRSCSLETFRRFKTLAVDAVRSRFSRLRNDRSANIHPLARGHITPAFVQSRMPVVQHASITRICRLPARALRNIHLQKKSAGHLLIFTFASHGLSASRPLLAGLPKQDCVPHICTVRWPACPSGARPLRPGRMLPVSGPPWA